MDERCRNLASAIDNRGPLAALVEQLEAHDARRHELQATLAITETRLAPFDRRAVESDVRNRLAQWRGMMRRNVGEARDVFRALLTGPFMFTPTMQDGWKGYSFVGEVGLDN